MAAPHKMNALTRRDSLKKIASGKAAADGIERLRRSELRSQKVNANELRAIEKGSSLTDKQRMFVRFWAAGETPRTAAAMAGYSESSNTIGYRMANDPDLLRLYQEEKKLFEQAAQMTRQRVMDMLKEAYDMAKMKAEPAVMVAAAREIGKMCGYYEPEVRININVGQKMEKLSTLTDEQLMKMIEDGQDVIPGESERVEDQPALESP